MQGLPLNSVREEVCCAAIDMQDRGLTYTHQMTM